MLQVSLICQSQIICLGPLTDLARIVQQHIFLIFRYTTCDQIVKKGCKKLHKQNSLVSLKSKSCNGLITLLDRRTVDLF